MSLFPRSPKSQTLVVNSVVNARIHNFMVNVNFIKIQRNGGGICFPTFAVFRNLMNNQFTNRSEAHKSSFKLKGQQPPFRK